MLADKDTVLSHLLQKDKSTRYFYRNMLQNDFKNEKRNIFNKWENQFGERVEWEKVFSNIPKLTIDTQIRNFQFKILHNIYPNNYILSKMGIKESPLCNLCSPFRDSLIHYIWECNKSQQFWRSVAEWIQRIFRIRIDLSLKSIIIGYNYNVNDNDNNTINFLILLAKHYIHCCKWNGVNPNIETIKAILKSRERAENRIAFELDKLVIHQQKWARILYCL